MKFNFSLDTAIIVSLFTVFFYACGKNYLAAYMAVFLIDPVVLNFSAADKINWGFLNCAEPIGLLLIFLLIIFYIQYLFSYFDIKIPFKLSLLKKKAEHIPPIHNSSIKQELIESRVHTSFCMMTVTLIIIVSFLSFAAIDIRASKAANLVLENPTSLPKVTLKSDKTLQDLHVIRCGINLCAVIDVKKNVSLVEPKNVVYLSSNFDKKQVH
ncbi:hypothetical protein [Acinetobacter tjernbergiae]|uniref:Uncharacterized protein n=1 Tax=Acinetobacter tjernbergiae DSM 14971 = CIP 107465 TaxID=1120928 RepID=V2W4G7_9GAMM|nr:hypothetical protein [Acinetobacter tjernbergiae]ESK54884.1 hypothetical protein F990_02327 [Acinetobacter tjernbergiae DSM 14971 = CIP 107465]